MTKKGAIKKGKKGGAGLAALRKMGGNGSGGIADDPLFNPEASGTETHPEPPPDAGEKKPLKMPGEVDAFRQVLQMMDAASEGQLDAIVDYCSQRDLKNLPQLDQDLWDMGISQVNKRRRVISYWARSMGLALDPNLAAHYRHLEPPQPEDAALPEKMKTPRRYYIEEDSVGNPKMRMAKPGEPAMSLKEANEAIRELRSHHGKEDEPVIIWSEQLGKHVPNAASEWVKTNMTAAIATAREYDRAMQQNTEPPDPLDVMIDHMGKVEAMKGMMQHAGVSEGKQSDIVSLVEAMGKLQEIGGRRGTSWMDDPIQFMAFVKSLTPERMVDPAVEMYREQNQQLIGKVNDLEAKFLENQFQQLREQNQQLVTAIRELQNRPAPGEPTAMSIMKDGLVAVEREAKGVRQDIKDLGKDLILSNPGDAGAAVKKAIGDTAELEALTDELIDLTS